MSDPPDFPDPGLPKEDLPPPGKRRHGRAAVALFLLVLAGGGVLWLMLNFLRAFGCALMLGLPGTC